MPVDYSKWDALELSDDSDIEVHPNVDKRSFIRAKQNQIHAERQQRRLQIETLKYERIVNDTLIKRISALLASLKAHASDAKTGNPGEVAFRAVMESAAGLDPKDDEPPARPKGVHEAEKPMPTYTKMMATLLDQVNKDLDEKKLSQEDRYDGMVAEIGEHLQKVNDLQVRLVEKLTELEKEEGRKITSESIHTGFDSSHVNKTASASTSTDASKIELINPNFAASAAAASSSSSTTPATTTPPKTTTSDDDTEESLTASPLAQKFALIPSTQPRDSLAFLSTHPQILTEKETDGILILAFDAELEDRPSYARNAVHQALLLQYCRALGRDGVALFFRRIGTPGHQAQEVFAKDVQETYMRIRTRAREIRQERERDRAAGKPEGVEQIQLHAVEPGTVINIRIPEVGVEGEEEKREIFEGFSGEMRRALETGKLEEVNKVLGEMAVDEAEEVVGLLSEAGILSLEDEIIDATTEEGQDRWKQIEEERKEAAAAEAAAEPVPDPE